MAVAKPAPHQRSPFSRFAERHIEANRWFRSTDVAHMAVRLLAKDRDPADLAQTLIPKKERWLFTFQHYYARCSEQAGQKATINDLREDLRDGWDDVLEATIVKEVGALEMFLREWSIEALNEALKPGAASLNRENKQKLQEALEVLISRPYESVSLTRIGELFPTLRTVLTGSTHLRALRPLLSPGTADLTCQSVAGLWRDVRNLILHHDRVVHPRFKMKYDSIWSSLHRDARERGSTVRSREVRIGNRLPIDDRHVVFCFTSCYQTAVVLHVATGADHEPAK